MVCHYNKIIARAHQAHLMNMEQRQAAAYTRTNATDLGWESTCRIYHYTPASTIYSIITQPESWYLFCCSTESCYDISHIKAATL